MWLLNTTSLTLKLVEDTSSHPYAILSHTWEHGEVTFQEIADLELARWKPGFSKIEQTCQLARDRGIKYAWVDTCCIDKSSSAELTEAINSMFQWYKNATICFAFLCDLPSLNDAYFQCRWFSRGWTLQELIAPQNIEFYDQEWQYRGTKISLQPQLSEITGIDNKVLSNSDTLLTISVARRMSWAATRVTSRQEDLAYCLFGIFDVHLPLIYGEGSKAFIRLQEAIAQDNNDLSLFAWMSTEKKPYRGIFARSPVEFRGCRNIQPIMDPAVIRTEFSMTNKGIHILSALDKYEGNLYLSLQCVDSSKNRSKEEECIIAIRIIKTTHGYVRYQSSKFIVISRLNFPSGGLINIHIPKDVSPAKSQSLENSLVHRFMCEVTNTSSMSHNVTQWPRHLWDPDTRSFLTDGYDEFTGLFTIKISGLKDSFDPNATLKLHHFSTHFMIFGLEPLEKTQESDALGGNSLRPWGTICEKLKYVSQVDPDSHRMFPDGLSQIRKLARGVSSSDFLPKTLVFKPDWRREGEFTSEIVPENGPQLRLSVSTEIVESNPIGMYRLVLTIEEE